VRDVPADQGAAEVEKCFMNVGTTFEANAKTTEFVETSVSPFGHSAEFSQATTMRKAANIGQKRPVKSDSKGSDTAVPTTQYLKNCAH
jgi:hypothetical protein